ncbi:apocarotenoid-15,15'-oxygenase-like [Montipora capricornis]|uniref:apocarotenoid-15,15'-oxygenase-like n=1 Tax=Montipora capricornis TaxID=246305 RepID=UPI0035F10F3E
MAKKSSFPDPLSQDIHRPLDLDKCSRGWETQEEHCYWIPKADIIGEVPKDLYGTLFRNGPGVNEVYGTRLKHPIDGDGMVCAVTFQDGQVHFQSKFVKSKHRHEEKRKKKFLYHGQMGTKPSTSAIGSLINALTRAVIHFRNPSNTNSFYWGGKVLTSFETHLPYCLDPYTLETLGPDNLNGNLHFGSFAAHFRIDSEKQRLVCLSLRPGFSHVKPSLAIYEFDRSWQLFQKQIHHIDGLNYGHDFVLLPDYYIFHMTPFVKGSWWITQKILLGWSSPGELMQYYPELPSRFVIIPRKSNHGDTGVMFVDTDPCHIFHFGTAQQTGSKIEFCAVCLDTKFDMTFDSKVWLSNASVSPGLAYKFTIDLAASRCTRTQVDRASVEFPSTHPYRNGMQGTRFNYFMACDRPGFNLPFRDIVKLNAENGQRQVWYSHGCLGEPVFVPRLGYDSWREGDEDDGYVIVQVYIPEKHVTEFCVLNAKDVGKGPLARIQLKHHVPYGFHGTFTPEVFTNGPKITSKL